MAVAAVLERGVRTKDARDCGDEHVVRGRAVLQEGWYQMAARLLSRGTVLDAGCGLGYGLEILARSAAHATGIDVDPQLARNDLDVRILPIEELPDRSFDAVACIDVIEHIPDWRAFAAHLVRVSRGRLFVTTPNYAVSLNTWPYHLHEFLPRELADLFAGYGRVARFVGDSAGDHVQPLERAWLYDLICWLYCWRGLHWAARALKRLLRVKIWPHHAVLVRVTLR